ncbi:MAG TPA: MBOAT family O-acyltransferase [Geminicoccus sp.]|uniref:MBOAT family O-acyltransferase n=1 Tax=Geminicoccus sp. TaxID=2024832 RepID=UPI002E2FF545|nr:MBOAT family O-acyltransferase [Geminicoccus sp.]HEX2525163.1 MBOAT family O-acyltransferase [Geminicoccus sp.]
MLFSSLPFTLGFLPVTLAFFLLLGRFDAPAHQRVKARIWLVLGASLVFYAYWHPPSLLLLVGSVLFNWSMGLLIADRKPARKWILALTVAVDLASIGFFKYGMFVTENAALVAGDWIRLEGILLPLGISFFTFQQIAYVVDVWRGDVEAERNLPRFALSVTFFPHLIAGPIILYRQIGPQFDRWSFARPTASDLNLGFGIFLIGLIKKIGIADTLSYYVDPAFDVADGQQAVGFIESWQSAIAYTFQLYFDFSGYSDMAIGLGLLFGIRIPDNFDNPYRSTSIIDFWQRWHMSLSSFLRNYLYIPLGGNRHGKVRRYVNLMITMLLGGLWHGASWNFVIWGGLNGVYLLIAHAWRASTGGMNLKAHPLAPWGRVAGHLLTMLAVVVVRVFFRATTLDGAWLMLKGMTDPSAGSVAEFEPFLLMAILAAYALCLYGAEAKDLIKVRWLSLPLARPVAAVWALLVMHHQQLFNLDAAFLYFNF